MRLKLSLLLVFIINFSWAQSGSTKTFTGNGTFPVPAGVTSVQVQAWGGGGSGGGASGAPLLLGRGAAGGGGGAYASNTLLVTPGTTLNVVVASQTSGTTGAGAAGGNSTIIGFESAILAAGGSGGDANNAGGSPIGGAGGTVAASAGTTKFAGANGGNGNSWNLLGLLLSSGAGGNGGGSGGAGGTAVSGLLLSNGPGNAGSPPGGAGSGAINSALGAAQIGGAGAAGRVIISYSCANFSLTSTAAANICASAGSTSTVTLTGSAASLPVGNYVVTYNRSSPSATALTANLTVSTAGTGTFTAVGLTVAGSSTITITNLTSETCSSTISTNNTATVIVSPETVGGTVTGGTTINAGSTSGLLTLSGHTGSVIKWQSSVSPFTTWTDIANTTTTYTSGVLNVTTQFRAVVQSGSCAVANSAATTVTINPRPTITLLASTVSHCSTNDGSSLSVFLPYTSTTETPITYSIVWDSSLPSTFLPVTDAVLPANQIQVDLPAGLVSGNFSGTLTVKNANGVVSSPGTSFTVTVNETPLITTTGEIDSVCTSANAQTATLTYSGVSGNPINYSINWSEDANAALLVDQPATSFAFSPSGGDIDTIQIPANVPAGTYYGSMNIFNGICNQSQNVTITIDPLPVGGAVTGGTTITSGNTSGLLTLSGHTGSVVKWQSSVSPFTTWVDLTLTDGITTYTSNPLTETTQFRAVVRSGITCDVAYSEPTTVTVEDLPTIALAAAAENVCSSNDFDRESTLSYSATTGDPITYSIVWNSSPTNNLQPIIDDTLPESPFIINVPVGTVPGTYTGTLTVKNANGYVSSPGSVFTLTVDPVPTITTDGLVGSVCESSSSQNTTLEYSGVTGNPIGYSITWFGDSEYLGDQDYTEFNFAPGVVL